RLAGGPDRLEGVAFFAHRPTDTNVERNLKTGASGWCGTIIKESISVRRPCSDHCWRERVGWHGEEGVGVRKDAVERRHGGRLAVRGLRGGLVPCVLSRLVCRRGRDDCHCGQRFGQNGR